MTLRWQQNFVTKRSKTHFLKIKIMLLCLLGSTFGLSTQSATEAFDHVQIQSLSSTMDQPQPPIDFQTTKRLHHCGDKRSNHYRLYTRHSETHRQRLSLLLMALNNGLEVTLRPKGCEGPRMLVDWIKISRP